MYAVVIFISSIIVSTVGMAKMPPPLAPQVETLRSVIARYHEQTSKFTSLSKQIENLRSNECIFVDPSNTKQITSCVVSLDRLVVELGLLDRSIPFIEEGFRDIPQAFSPIGTVLKKDLNEKEVWLKETSKRLKD